MVAWLASRALRPQVTGREGKKHLREALAAVLFPLSALIAALFASMLLAAANQHVLDVMVALLTAAIIIRLAVLMLQQVFAPSGWRDTLIRVIAVVVWIGFALRVAGLADDTVRFLDGLGFEVGKSRISLWLILRGLMSMLATVLIALWLGRLIEARAMRATDLDINLRVMISKLAQALLVLVAILLALPAVSVTVVAARTGPCPKVVRSNEVNTTGCADPFPLNDLVTVPDTPVKTTLTEAPVSALTESTPVVASASVVVLLPLPNAVITGAGAVVSTTSDEANTPAPLILPAASICLTCTAFAA